ncbi:MAG: glutamate--cysteine ligase, partial [Spirochaetota bacterium]|nr:glutamate--cysteine ligase [Spirochaetota bacterium]
MGQEIARHYFTENDFKEFHVRLKNETRLLDEMLRDKGFSGDHGVGGFELEAWIIDDNCMPLAINEEFMAHVGDPLLESELACFNIEINTHPYRLEGNVLSKFHRELEKIWSSCLLSARDFDAKLILTGILPTVTNSDLKPENMSKRKRYRALNDQIMLQRQGNPICIDIKAKDHLKLNHFDVMLEAATTAFQLQFQVDIAHSVRFINAAMILSAPVVAVTANSPFLFGLDLWDETRIPLFEQSVTLRTEELDSVDMSKRRVTFGSGYVKDSVVECFTENRERYEV